MAQPGTTNPQQPQPVGTTKPNAATPPAQPATPPLPPPTPPPRRSAEPTTSSVPDAQSPTGQSAHGEPAPQSSPSMPEQSHSRRQPAGTTITLSPKMLLGLALAGGLILICIPVLLWLVPWHSFRSSNEASASASVSASASAPPVDPMELRVKAALNGGVATPEVKLGAVRMVKCQKPGPGRTRPEDCDPQPWFAEMLVRSVLENVSCAPERSGTVSVALKVDYRRRKIKIFAGKSGSLRGRRARGLIKCLRASFPTPDWAGLPHDHTKYLMAVMATYPGKDTEQ